MLLWFPSHISKDTILEHLSAMDKSTFKQKVQDWIHSRYPAFDHYKVYVDNEFKEIDTTCSICYEDADYQLNCGHIFHKRCIKQWLQKQRLQKQQRTCPMCRAPI